MHNYLFAWAQYCQKTQSLRLLSFSAGPSGRGRRDTLNTRGSSGWLLGVGTNSGQDPLWQARGLIADQSLDPYPDSAFGHRCSSLSVSFGTFSHGPSHVFAGVRPF